MLVTNSVNAAASDLSLNSLLRPVCPNKLGKFSTISIILKHQNYRSLLYQPYDISIEEIHFLDQISPLVLSEGINVIYSCRKDAQHFSIFQGPVVQSVVSLTSSLRVISLTVLADSIHNILIFFAEKMWVAFAMQKLLTFFQQKISAYLCITRLKF